VTHPASSGPGGQAASIDVSGTATTRARVRPTRLKINGQSWPPWRSQHRFLQCLTPRQTAAPPRRSARSASRLVNATGRIAGAYRRLRAHSAQSAPTTERDWRRCSMPPGSPNICISPRAAVIALSSTDQPVRGGLTAIRYRRSRAAPAAVSPRRDHGTRASATGSAIAMGRSRAGAQGVSDRCRSSRPSGWGCWSVRSRMRP
jgi:hypothetical protein